MTTPARVDRKRDYRGCLDQGYVLLVDHMGNDLSVVNAARASFMKESREWDDKDERLLRFLWRECEYSPFRHATMTFEVYAPLMIARQWWKYIVGGDHDPLMAWNESSRRYVTETPRYYRPQFRAAPENRKQGSGEFLPVGENVFWCLELERLQDETTRTYEKAIERGVAPEQARVFLLAYGMYVRWRWTCSLQGALWFMTQRLEEKAQSEIREYAEAVHDLVALKFPITVRAFDEERDV